MGLNRHPIRRKHYGETWMGEATVLDQPYTDPPDPLRDGADGIIPIRHMVRVDEPMFDDEMVELNGVSGRFPIGAEMPKGQMEVMDDYRMVYDGSHA